MTLLDDRKDHVSLDDVLALDRARPTTRLRGGVPRPTGLWPRRIWLAVLAGLVVWSVRDALGGDGEVVNPGGWAQVGDFVSAAVRPELDGEFLRTVGSAAATTVGYALVGTALALAIGLVGGVLTSETLWARDPLADAGRQSRSHPGRWLVKVAATLARGTHEAVWALVLLSVLGRDPWVAVLAIGVPFGAVTAKVVAEMLDDADQAPVQTLRAAGAGRLGAMVYGLGATVQSDVASYSFYRFECALRSSVVLGMIGAGGIGFELAQSFQSLQYREMWTLIYTLCIVALAVDRWGVSLRRRPSRRYARASLLGAVAATVYAVWALDLRLLSLVDARARRLFGDLVSEAFPPRLPPGGWSALIDALVDTVQMSLVAIGLAAVIAGPVSFLAARPDRGRRVGRALAARPDRGGGVKGRAVAGALRGLLLVMRTCPPPLWAFVVLFVVFPGPLPGGIALGLYTVGVLGRLGADVVENSDPAPARSLRAAGASATSAFAYGTVPTVAPRFASLTMYRWEVVQRETVVVGLVGAGGLGRLLAEQNAAQDEAAMLTTVLTLVAAAFLVDLVSTRIRAALR